MAKVISQETFDDVVKENIVDFSMSPDEAKEETIKQFEAQVYAYFFNLILTHTDMCIGAIFLY